MNTAMNTTATIDTGDLFLDDVSIEFKHMQNIDTFNNAFTWAFHLDTWNKIGRPREINNYCYSQSPWMAVFKKVGERLNCNKNQGENNVNTNNYRANGPE
jgi:hypothetical protein